MSSSNGRGPSRSLGVDELLARRLPSRPWLLTNLMRERDYVLLSGARGVGKTHFVVSLAYAIASGSRVLRYEPVSPAGVLHVDGEMHGVDLQDRYRALARANAANPLRAPLRVLAADLLDDGLPSLATEKGQAVVEHELTTNPDVRLVVVDSISTLCQTPHPENDPASWQPLQAWLLRLRRRGIATLFVHHSGKTSDQRGTSHREDVASQVLVLKRPADYVPDQGARFEVHLTKGRGVYGPAAEPYEASLVSIDGSTGWVVDAVKGTTAAESRNAEIRRLVTVDGVSQSDVAKRLGCDRSTVSRVLSKGSR